MYGITTWVFIIRNMLHSDLKGTWVRSRILSSCLVSAQKVHGCYAVDQNKVWECIILKDRGCQRRLAELGITDIYGVLSYYEQQQYKEMRSTWPKKYFKKGH